MTASPERSQSWVNKGSNPLPEWIEPHVARDREPNGSFLIRTRIGRDSAAARVHVHNAVIVSGGIAYTSPADEISEVLAALAIQNEAVPPSTATTKGGRPPNVAAKKSVASPPPPSRTRAFADPLGDPPSIEWVKVDKLTVDTAYQRSTDNQASQRLINSIAAKFDWRLCAPLVVSRRPDGTLTVIDGQHRTLAAAKRGDIPHLPCCVFRYEGPEEEARMFIAANRARKPMNRLDDFHAALAAGDSDAVLIKQLVSDAGLSVARNTASTAWRPGEIAFTASIATVVRKHGSAVAATALTEIARAFGNQRVVHSGSIFLGMVKLLTSPPAGFDAGRLSQALRHYTAEEWGSFVAGLKGGDTRATAIRDALLMAYEEVPTSEVGAAQ